MDVFPAPAYAELVPAAFESLHRLKNYLYDPNAPITNQELFYHFEGVTDDGQ